MLLSLLSVRRERRGCLWRRAEVFRELMSRIGRMSLTGVVGSRYIFISYLQVRSRGYRGNLQSHLRGPKNLINGVRSECAAAAEAWRRALVANILEARSPGWVNSY